MFTNKTKFAEAKYDGRYFNDTLIYEGKVHKSRNSGLIKLEAGYTLVYNEDFRRTKNTKVLTIVKVNETKDLFTITLIDENYNRFTFYSTNELLPKHLRY